MPNEVDGPRTKPEEPGTRITGKCALRRFGFIEIDADWNQIYRGTPIRKGSEAWSGYAIPARANGWSKTDLRLQPNASSAH